MNTKKTLSQKGLTLIELIVAIFIFSLITVAILSVFVSTVTAYGKARAIKSVKENTEFALNSIAKDVRMGTIESTSSHANGSNSDYFLVKRNRDAARVCYVIVKTSGISYLGKKEGIVGNTCPNPSSTAYDKIIDLTGKNMNFAGISYFYSCPTDVSDSPVACPARVSGKHRGWVEINLSIVPVAGKEMETDQINVQTIVSSRDYGWEEIP